MTIGRMVGHHHNQQPCKAARMGLAAMRIICAAPWPIWDSLAIPRSPSLGPRMSFRYLDGIYMSCICVHIYNCLNFGDLKLLRCTFLITFFHEDCWLIWGIPQFSARCCWWFRRLSWPGIAPSVRPRPWMCRWLRVVRCPLCFDYVSFLSNEVTIYR